MDSFNLRRSGLALGVAVAGFAALPAHADLIADGGFEDPPSSSTTPAGSPGQGYTPYAIGASFGTGNVWTVAVEPGTVGIPTNNFTLSPTVEYAGPNIFYNAHSGTQAADLSGGYDNGDPVGIVQTVATTGGTTYALSYWLGSWVDQPDAVANLYVNGAFAQQSVNASNTGGRGSLSADPTYPAYVDGNLWEEFTYEFTASGASTSIGFYNGSAPGVSEVGLDDIALSAVSVAVPEPVSLTLMLGGLGLIVASRRRRHV